MRDKSDSIEKLVFRNIMMQTFMKKVCDNICKKFPLVAYLATKLLFRVKVFSSFLKRLNLRNVFIIFLMLFIIIIILIVRIQLFMEVGHIHLDNILSNLLIKLVSNINFASLTGDDFGVPMSDTISDDGKRLSTDPSDWGFSFDKKFGSYYSTDRKQDARIFAIICDYLFKVHDVKYINKDLISIVFKDNASARDWFGNYDNSWGKKPDDTYENTQEFRDKLRNLKFYKDKDYRRK